MAPKMSPGEQVIFAGHPSWRSILRFYVKWIAITAAVALVVGIVSQIAGDDADVRLVSIVAVVGVALTIGVGFVKRIATEYRITTRRLRIKRGIVSRTIQETRLERVQNVSYEQTLLQRILRIGDVDFDTAAGEEHDFVFAGVAQPEEVVHQVDRATRLAGDDGLGARN